MSAIEDRGLLDILLPHPVVGEAVDEPVVAIASDDILAGLVAGFRHRSAGAAIGRISAAAPGGRRCRTRRGSRTCPRCHSPRRRARIRPCGGSAHRRPAASQPWPKVSNSSFHQPLTILIAARPPLMRSSETANLATACGVMMPGCTATISSILLVSAASAEASIQAEWSVPIQRSASRVVSKPSSSPRLIMSTAKRNALSGPLARPRVPDSRIASFISGSGRMVCGNGVQTPNRMARHLLVQRQTATFQAYRLSMDAINRGGQRCKSPGCVDVRSRICELWFHDA